MEKIAGCVNIILNDNTIIPEKQTYVTNIKLSSIKFENKFKESAKLHAMRVKNVLACQGALRAYVPTCQRAYALKFQRVLHAYVLPCQCALRVYVFTC